MLYTDFKRDSIFTFFKYKLPCEQLALFPFSHTCKFLYVNLLTLSDYENLHKD